LQRRAFVIVPVIVDVGLCDVIWVLALPCSQVQHWKTNSAVDMVESFTLA